MNIGQIITYVILGITVLFFVLGILWGLKRGTLRSVTRLITLIIAAASALIITLTVNSKFGTQIQNFVRDYLTQNAQDFADLINASPTMMSYAIEVVCVLVSPILYAVLFFILRIVLWVVYAIITLFFPSKKKHPIRGLSRLGGAAVSVVGAAIITLSLLMPVAGYLSYASGAYATVAETGLIPAGALSADMEDQIVGVKENPAVRAVNTYGGDFLFRRLTSMGKTTATQELDVLLGLVPAVMDLQEVNFNAIFDDGEDLSLAAVNDGLLPAIEKSEKLKTILAEVLSYAGTKWKNGETFMSINIKEQVPAEYAGSIDGILNRISVTTSETVIADLRDFSDAVMLLSRTYTYFVNVTDTTNTTMDGLKDEISGILNTITPGTAEIVTQALSDQIVNSAQVGGESAATILEIMNSSLTTIAEMSEEQRAAEADAINQLVSYSSQVRRDEVDTSGMIDTILSSESLRTSIEETATPDPETGEVSQITVSATQKAALDAALAEKSLTATEEQLATLQALEALFAVSTPSGSDT